MSRALQGTIFGLAALLAGCGSVQPLSGDAAMADPDAGPTPDAWQPSWVAAACARLTADASTAVPGSPCRITAICFASRDATRSAAEAPLASPRRTA